MSDARRRAEAAGRRAERLALFALRLKGYRLIAVRFACPQGEIDLIMRRGRTVAFIEVKARAALDAAAYAIDARQQARIAAAAAVFLQRNPALGALDARFDAVLVAPGRWPRHMANAWQT